MKNSRPFKGSMYFFILRSFAGMSLVSILVLAGIYYFSFFIENRIIESIYGAEIFSQEVWPSEIYSLCAKMDRITMAAALTVFVIIVLIYTDRIRKKLLRPLETLNAGIEGFASGGESYAAGPTGITEIDRINDNFRSMTEKLKENEREKQRSADERRRIMAGISHDLRTPVTVIRGYAGAISEGLADEETETRYVRTIYRRAEELSDLIDSLYEYARLDHPGFAPELKKGDICSFVREYLAGRYDETEAAGCMLEADIPDEELMCRFDRRQLSRAFDNILNNSIKHNGPGTVLTAELSRDGESAVIRLGDNGSGIPDSIKDRVFDPLVTGSDYRPEGGGSGLGLSIASMIAASHGGSIMLEEAGEGCGAVFAVRLPLCADADGSFSTA